MSRTKFVACKECYHHGCEPTPEDDTTRFTQSISASTWGDMGIWFDEDGDVVEGDEEWHGDQGDTDYGDINCVCCQHYVGYSTNNLDEYVVELAYDDESERVTEWSAEYEDDEDEDDVSVPPFTIATPAIKDDGRFVAANIADLAAAIGSTADAVRPDAPEVKITYGT